MSFDMSTVCAQVTHARSPSTPRPSRAMGPSEVRFCNQEQESCSKPFHCVQEIQDCHLECQLKRGMGQPKTGYLDTYCLQSCAFC